MAATGAATARLSLSVRLHVGQPAPSAQQDTAANKDVAVLSAVAGSASRLLALAGALSPGADVGVLRRAMEELERLAAGGRTGADRVDPSASAGASTAADMDIDSVVSSRQLGCGTGAASRGSRSPGTKRKREARRGGGGVADEDDNTPGVFQRPAKRRILAWRARQYRSLVAKAKATARRARSRRAAAQAQAQPMRSRRRKAGGWSWKGVEQQLARATLSDGLHRWSPGGGPAEQ